jgi:hypothetical protein
MNRNARRPHQGVRKGSLMNTCVFGFFKANLIRFFALYQLVPSFVKQNLCPRATKCGAMGTILVFIVLAAPLQQGQCLTPEEIAYLKKAGVSDETIQLMIQEENERGRPSQTGIWEVEDEKGNRSTLYQVGDDEDVYERDRIEQEKVDRAWEMLNNLVIDTRRFRGFR